MNDLRKKMDAELKAMVIPTLRTMNFTGSMPHFRRLTSTGIDLLTFQFDKWGGGFVVEIAQCEIDGIKTYWGKEIPPSKVTAHDLHPNDRRRLKPREGSDTNSWFRFDEGQYQLAAKQVLECLKNAETWWYERAQQNAPTDAPNSGAPLS